MVVVVGRGAEEHDDVGEVDLSSLDSGLPHLLVDRSHLEAAGGDGLDGGVVGSGEARLAREVVEREARLVHEVLRHQAPGRRGVGAERQRVASELAQSVDVVERCEAGLLGGDEEAGELGVDVALGKGRGAFYALCGLDSGEATHPGDRDVADFEATHDCRVFGDRGVGDVEPGGVGEAGGHVAVQPVEHLGVLVGDRRDREGSRT